MTPVVNFDWLELYCIESGVLPLSVSNLESLGYSVRVREYGTPIYKEVLTICVMDDKPFLEVRRNPYSVRSAGGIMQDGACHIRLVNIWCYVPGIIKSIRETLDRLQVTLVNIQRCDICCDFTQFSDGKLPADFVRQYMCEEYYKEYQPRVRAISQTDTQYISAHGTDEPRGRVWNSLAWGSGNSLIKTRLYNKTYEMQVVKPKNYIKSIWLQHGWNGVDDVWRCEFEVKASTSWIAKERGELYRIELHDIEDPWNRLCWFHALAAKYFRFREVVLTRTGERQRKDRCPLFLPLRFINADVDITPYVPRLQRDPTKSEERLLKLLQRQDVPWELQRSKEQLTDFLRMVVWKNPVQ